MSKLIVTDRIHYEADYVWTWKILSEPTRAGVWISGATYRKGTVRS